MKINLIGSDSIPDNIDEQMDDPSNNTAPGIEAAFTNLVPDNTILDWSMANGKIIWHTYEAPDGSPPPTDEEIWHEYSKAFIRWNSKTEELKLFSTPLISSFPTVDLNQIKKDCLDLALRNPQNEISNRGGYQGHGFVNQELNNAILNLIPATKINSGYDYEIEGVYAWVNINGKGDYNRVHNHKGLLDGDALWCGVFYVEVPDDSGSIVFLDPRGSMLSDVNHVIYNNTNDYEILPKSGQLVLFPSWLQHHVLPNKQSLERISVAFNVTGKIIKIQ